ncbi:hypothetical protein AN958_11195 [Leucoagaricus sp. SymC.cos]|nr:hypothetical protein AN958_11195 [Leucoagaricus sp. SymC.cos]
MAFVAAIDYLKEKYGIQHICISPYNSQSNSAVERTHCMIQDALVKACNGKI